MIDWRAKEVVVSAVMAALGAMWLSAAWSATDWAPAYNIALKLALASACFAVVANPFVLFEHRSFSRLFAGYEPRTVAFGLLAVIGIFCAVASIVLWLVRSLVAA